MIALSSASQNWAGDALGLWKVNPARSSVRYSNIETVGFQRHAKGEVFTLYRFDGKGRATTSSTILYFDSIARDLQDFGCSGSQSSRRVDSQTVETLRTCVKDGWIRFVRRSSAQPNDLVLEITEQQAGGRRFEWHLVLEKLR
jgi:hypothetical protein